MGFLDFLFGRKQQSVKGTSVNADDSVSENQKADAQEIATIKPFVFKSDCHQRYEHGQPVMGLQKCGRTVRVQENTDGCQGYRLPPGIGYIVSVYNDDLGKPNMSDKPMKVVRKTDACIELRGFPIEAMSPFGWQEVDYRDYGFVVYYNRGKVEKCVLHMYDRDTRIEYMREAEGCCEEEIETASPIKCEVDSIIKTYGAGDISLLQQKLYELYSKLNKPGGGRLVTLYPEKDRLCEVFIFCLRYDWLRDDDIREVWAENAFYCIAEYFKQASSAEDKFAAALDLFLTCAYGKRNLYPKFNDILVKASMHPFHNTIFSMANYAGGASHLVREFMFFSATIISPVVRRHPQVIGEALQSEYEASKTDFEFALVNPMDIMKKMMFISKIIGSILEDM